MDTHHHTEISLPFHIRNDSECDAAILDRVVDRDCYRLLELNERGVYPKVVIDVGAHIGTFASFVHILWPAASIYCIEPDERSFELLELNAPFATRIRKSVCAEEIAGIACISPQSSMLDCADTGVAGPDPAEGAANESGRHASHNLHGMSTDCLTFDELTARYDISQVDLLKLSCGGAGERIMRQLSEDVCATVRRVVAHQELAENAEGFLGAAEKAFPHLRFNVVEQEDARLFFSERRIPLLYEEPVSLLCTQAAMDGPGYARICEDVLKTRPVFHRKHWECAYIWNMLFLHDKLRQGAKGLGFGCGIERLVPVFLKTGVDLVVTDLDGAEAAAKGWVKTNQHSLGLDGFKIYCPDLCSLEELEKATFRNVDMNDVPADLMRGEFDFIWSSCSLEHVGSMRQAMDFVLRTVRCLKPGGVAVHTTEFNLTSNQHTILKGSTVLFRRSDILELKNELERFGAYMYPVTFDPGSKELDNYVDAPPYPGNLQGRHLKLQVGEYRCTSIGICIKRCDALSWS